ncbi:unnamed protein product [Ambrosiozyma monospora]|uniref:Unnamed protein product n=1 Tax=Ambrosiozyma monospora TaxID=43982 RepID=A0ACB5UBK8_AMBMO|nr:unnamed protein product [Ambrosiozyma monospora]
MTKSARLLADASAMPPPAFPSLSINSGSSPSSNSPGSTGSAGGSSTKSSSSAHSKKQQLVTIATFYSLEPMAYKNINIPNQKLIKLGRSKSKNDIVLSKPDCSTTHCEISVNKLKDVTILSIKDKSLNGVFINGQLLGCNNSAILKNNDKISFAGSLHYMMKCADETMFSKFHEKYEVGAVLGFGHYSQVKEIRERKKKVARTGDFDEFES